MPVKLKTAYLWKFGHYGIQVIGGDIKAITAIASILTIIQLLAIMPQAFTLKRALPGQKSRAQQGHVTMLQFVIK